MYMKTKGSSDFIIEVDVTFDVDAEFNVEEEITVTHFHSWRYSNLFMKDQANWQKLNKHEDLPLLRKAVMDVTNYVNLNGGWTIIGWICSG